MSASTRVSTRDRGRAIEQAVAAYLDRSGLEVIDRNYEAAGAEVDLIACERRPDGSATYVFIEVRSRRSTRYGSALETIDRRKQRAIVRAATAWLVDHDQWERVEVRFDAVAVNGVGDEADVVWVRNAFEC